MRIPRPSYANAMSTLAVILALGTGTAYAAGLAPNSVKGKHIATNAIKTRHLNAGAVQGSALKVGAVGAREIRDGQVGLAELAPNAVVASAIASGAVGESELANAAVSKAKIKGSAVDSSKIQDETITAIDIKAGSISSPRLSAGVQNLLFNTGVLAVNRTYSDITVSSTSWPGGAPNSGAQITTAWTQAANTVDIASATARVSYPTGCTASAANARGFDVKIVDAGGRVVSASSPQRTGGTNYNGNGFWDQQAALPGVEFRAPHSVDLANSPVSFVDYIHLPMEMAEFVTGGSATERALRFYFKANSASCSPSITNIRVMVIRYGTS